MINKRTDAWKTDVNLLIRPCIEDPSHSMMSSKRVSMGLTVNRQMAKKLTVNRQKRNIITVNRQMNESKLAVKILGYA